MRRFWHSITMLAVLSPIPARADLLDSRIAFHVQQAGTPATACTEISVPCSQFSTSGDLNTNYFVYIVLVDQPPDGFAAVSLGIDYTGYAGGGLYMTNFIKCSDLSFESIDWPQPGTGAIMTWALTNCQQDVVPGYPSEGVHAVAGVLAATAYGNDVLDITPFPNNNKLEVSDCSNHTTTLTDNTHWGSARFSPGGTDPGYNPCTGAGGPPPPPPPPPPDTTDALVMLHAQPLAAGGSCDDAPAAAGDIVTAAGLGAGYFVYLLAQPDQPYGLAGLQLGLDYAGGAYTGSGLALFDWYKCSDLEFRGPGWPASGTGITLTWEPGSHCQSDPVSIAGYWYAYAYTPSALCLVGYPQTGLAKSANCNGAESVRMENQLGWVSFGGAAKGGDNNGCNPALEDCFQQPISVRKTTWSAIKAGIDHPGKP